MFLTSLVGHKAMHSSNPPYYNWVITRDYFCLTGFQHRELAGANNGASFDDLCMNYAQERLQMLFHDSTFTSEQDRYIQENINWVFSEVAVSPLPVIDAIDKHVPQVRRVYLHS